MSYSMWWKKNVDGFGGGGGLRSDVFAGKAQERVGTTHVSIRPWLS